MATRTDFAFFVPLEFQTEISVLAKEELVAMLWDYCVRIAGEGNKDAAMNEFRTTRRIMLRHCRAVMSGYRS